MKTKTKTVFWWVLVLGGVAGLLAHATVRADARPPEPRVGYVCVAGLAVELARDDRYAGRGSRGLEWPGIMPAERCRLPLMPSGLPGEHLMSAMTVDRRGGVTSSMVQGEKAEALGRATEHLAAQGWKESPASSMARGRNGALDLAVLMRPGGVLHVAAVDGGDGSSVIVAAGSFDPEKKGGAR